MKRRIDLHIHTTISDGYLSPKEVIDEAVKNDVLDIAIADHDTIDAYSKELVDYAKSKNVNLISAVEISTQGKKAGIHVLGYDIDLTNEELRQTLYRIRNSRHIYLHKVAERLESIGYRINVEELDKIEAVTKAHIAMDIITNPENRNKLLKDFEHIPNKGEFIESIMNENCIAYVKKEMLSPREAAEIIRRAKGKVVLAHPVAYEYESGLTEADIEQIVREMKPDGIEANYIYVDKENTLRDHIKKWNDFARKHNLFVTCGSDFHNKDGIRPEIGFINTNFELREDEMEQIINNI